MNKFSPTYKIENFRMITNVMRAQSVFKTQLTRIAGVLVVLLLIGNHVFAQSNGNEDNGYDIVTPTDISTPPAPTLRVVPGDGRVTLYWDDVAESFSDPALAGTGRSARNFEGYKIYKSTDPEFLDALRITDNRGDTLQGFRPIAQFDRANDIRGYHPAAVRGVRFFLGGDSGIERFYIDENVMNGRTYYYAVVAYTHGDALPGFAIPLINPQTGQIYDPPLFDGQVYTHSPRESKIDASVNHNTGEVLLGRNVVEVVPNRPVFGYIAPENPVVTRLSGSAGGEIEVQVIDPALVLPENEYAITFKDTIILGQTTLDPDLVVTQSFSLTNLNSGEVIFQDDPRFRDEQLQIREGLLVSITNAGDTVSVNSELSQWNSQDDNFIHDFNFSVNTRFSKLADYRIEFADGALSRSTNYNLQVGNLTQTLPAEDVNFRVINTTSNEEIPFAFFVNPNIPRDLRDVFFIDNNQGWAVGGAGQLRKTTNGGADWVSIVTGTDARLYNVHFVDGSYGWAVGAGGTVIHSQDGGETWADQSPGTSAELRGVSFKDRLNGFAVGNNGLILRTGNGGITWTNVTSGSIRLLRSIEFIDENIGHIVGDRSTILRTTNGGVTWTEIPTNQFVGGTTGDRLRNMNFVHFYDNLNGWIVGFTGVIWNTTNGGATWSRQPSVNNTRLNSVVFIDANNGWAVGENGQIITTSNGGVNWAIQTSGVTTPLFGAAATGNNTIQVVGQGPTILKTEDGGTNWTQTTTEKRFRAFIDQNGQARSDEIYFIEDFGTQSNVITWRVSMTPDPRGQSFDPGAGDQLELVTIKPFTSADEYRFTIGENNVPKWTSTLQIPEDRLKDIRVVPNPYVVTHIGERQAYGPNSSMNELHFINLPRWSRIKIFNVSGQLVDQFEVINSLDNDRYVWNMRNRFGELIPYGVYIYYVDAPGIGQHTGKFAVIK